MSEHFDNVGYEDCALSSGDDYEPYGYLPPELRQVEFAPQPRQAVADRVIEAELLAHWGMVGC